MNHTKEPGLLNLFDPSLVYGTTPTTLQQTYSSSTAGSGIWTLTPTPPGSDRGVDGGFDVRTLSVGEDTRKEETFYSSALTYKRTM